MSGNIIDELIFTSGTWGVTSQWEQGLGWKITHVDEGELGARAGLQAGDVVTHVGLQAADAAVPLDQMVNQVIALNQRFFIARDINSGHYYPVNF